MRKRILNVLIISLCFVNLVGCSLSTYVEHQGSIYDGMDIEEETPTPTPDDKEDDDDGENSIGEFGGVISVDGTPTPTIKPNDIDVTIKLTPTPTIQDNDYDFDGYIITSENKETSFVPILGQFVIAENTDNYQVDLQDMSQISLFWGEKNDKLVLNVKIYDKNETYNLDYFKNYLSTYKSNIEQGIVVGEETIKPENVELSALNEMIEKENVIYIQSLSYKEKETNKLIEISFIETEKCILVGTLTSSMDVPSVTTISFADILYPVMIDYNPDMIQPEEPETEETIY